MKATVRRTDLLYPELSYQIIGILFDVSNQLGYQYQERYYQKAVAALLQKTNIPFQEQVAVQLKIGDKTVAKGYVDFLVDEKVIIEIKRGERFLKTNIDQLNSYLQLTGIQLGILANFTSQGLQFKRIIHSNS